MSTKSDEKLLEVIDLKVEFRTDDGIVKAVDGVSFELEPGQTLGIVGESGSGKSVSNLAIMGLVPQPPGKITGGQALYRGQDLLKMSNRQMREFRGDRIAMIFQDPMTALNPFLTVEEQLAEVTRTHRKHTRSQARKHAIEMLEMVGIPSADKRIDDFPHQFSGGMRQRVMIAMALSCQPDILIADEPTTALDVTIQAQILDLMRDLQRTVGTSIILITHDMGVIAGSCDKVHVMYAGRIVEKASVKSLFDQPRHPYSLGLLNSIPRLDERPGESLEPIPGQPPDLAHLPSGCPFMPRCPYQIADCEKVDPKLQPAGDGMFACHVDVTQTKPHGVVGASDE